MNLGVGQVQLARHQQEDIGLKPHDAEAMLNEIKVRQPVMARNSYNAAQATDSPRTGITEPSNRTGGIKKSKRIIVPLPDNRLSHYPDP